MKKKKKHLNLYNYLSIVISITYLSKTIYVQINMYGRTYTLLITVTLPKKVQITNFTNCILMISGNIYYN